MVFRLQQTSTSVCLLHEDIKSYRVEEQNTSNRQEQLQPSSAKDSSSIRRKWLPNSSPNCSSLLAIGAASTRRPCSCSPGVVITWYVTKTPIPDAYKIELKNYLLRPSAPRKMEDGVYITEGDSSVFGTAMNYVALRLLGADAEDHASSRL